MFSFLKGLFGKKDNAVNSVEENVMMDAPAEEPMQDSGEMMNAEVQMESEVMSESNQSENSEEVSAQM